LAIFPDMAHIVIPPQAIIIGMPMFIMVIMRSQHSINMSFMESSIGVISHFIPVGVMVQVILHIIIAVGIMLFIMGIGIMLPSIGIMVGIGIAAVMGSLHPVVVVRRRATLAAGRNQRQIAAAAFFRPIDEKL
jgi:hypothetical protein